MRLPLWLAFLLLTQTGFAAPLRIVVLGDSLTDGYGVAREEAYPALLGQKLKAAGFADAEVVNAGISGSTTASAEGRLKWHLKRKPDVLVLALGANDGLRGLKIDQTRMNLSRVIDEAKQNGITVLLAGIQVPPNYGESYARQFAALYPELARKHSVELVPFLLEGVGGERELNLSDGIHPNEKGHRKMAETIFPYLLKLLKKRN